MQRILQFSWSTTYAFCQSTPHYNAPLNLVLNVVRSIKPEARCSRWGKIASRWTSVLMLFSLIKTFQQYPFLLSKENIAQIKNNACRFARDLGNKAPGHWITNYEMHAPIHPICAANIQKPRRVVIRYRINRKAEWSVWSKRVVFRPFPSFSVGYESPNAAATDKAGMKPERAKVNQEKGNDKLLVLFTCFNLNTNIPAWVCCSTSFRDWPPYSKLLTYSLGEELHQLTGVHKKTEDAVRCGDPHRSQMCKRVKRFSFVFS